MVGGGTVITAGPFEAKDEDEVAEQVKAIAKEGVFDGNSYYPPAGITKIVIQAV